jgi:hypothetical protein
MSAPTPKEATAADELVEALFGGPPVCAKQPDLRCLPECEYGLGPTPCVRLALEALK